MNVSGKTVLLTGGTNGIGREIALQMQAKGAQVITTGRNPDRVAATRADSASPAAVFSSAIETGPVRAATSTSFAFRMTRSRIRRSRSVSCRRFSSATKASMTASYAR